MKLSREDSDAFFRLMWSLQFFVNRKKGILPNAGTVEEYRVLFDEERILVRDALWAEPQLIGAYVAENPDRLDEGDLATVAAWSGFIRGEFFIERYLSDYAVFIGDSGVYGVRGLFSDLDEMFPKYLLPLRVQTVLLPFRGMIVYDGLMRSYNIRFGGGIKGQLRESYMRAKQQGRIITTLDGEAGEASARKAEKPAQQSKDWSNELAELTATANKLKGGGNQPAINAPVFSLLRACLDLASEATSRTENPEAILEELRKVERATAKVKTVLSRM